MPTQQKQKFVKPGTSARIPPLGDEKPAIRYLKIKSIKDDVIRLENGLKEIEDDRTFITKAMIAGLQVPKSINSTFSRIQGRIYDIEKEIEFDDTTQDKSATIIQTNFRKFSTEAHFGVIKSAIQNTARRDCSPFHQILLAFLLSYSKKDDHFKIQSNRRMIGKSRAILRYWRVYSTESHSISRQQKSKIVELQNNWVMRRIEVFIRKWHEISFSKHSRKNLKKLQEKNYGRWKTTYVK